MIVNNTNASPTADLQDWEVNGVKVSAITSTGAFSGNAATSTTATNMAGGGVGSAPYQSTAATTALIASPTTSGHTFAYVWQPSGSAIAPAALDLATYLASPPAIGGTTAGAIAGTTGTFSGGITATSDGVHPGQIALPYNSTANAAPTLATGWEGAVASSGTPGWFDLPAALPTVPSVMNFAAAASSHSVPTMTPLAGTGAAVPTGPSSSTSGDVTEFTGTVGQMADSGVSAAAAFTSNFYSNGSIGGTTPIYSANGTQFGLITFAKAQSYAHIYYSVATLDATTTHYYDLGIYDCEGTTPAHDCSQPSVTGTLVCDIGARDLIAAGDAVTACAQGGTITSQPGTYLLAWVGSATTAQFEDAAVGQVIPFVNATLAAATAGQLPSTVTTPTAGTTTYGTFVVAVSLK